jgi:ribonuclease HI
MKNTLIPHYLLLSESTAGSSSSSQSESSVRSGRWRIVLEAVDGSSKFEASDDEDLPAERLELLAVVRGLEAIPQPARVTLVTASHYVSRGLRFGLSEWRENGWQWERYGELSPVTNADLWQRLDRALGIHQVQCRTWRFDPGRFDPGHRDSCPVPAPHGRSRECVRRAGSIRERTRHVLTGMKSWLGRPRGEMTSLCAS